MHRAALLLTQPFTASVGFHKYPSLDVQQRSQLVSEATAAISIPTAPRGAVSLSPQANLSPSTSHSISGAVSTQPQQDLERIASSKSAGTSYVSGGDSPSNGVTHARTHPRQTDGEGFQQESLHRSGSSNGAGLPVAKDATLPDKHDGGIAGGLDGVAESIERPPQGKVEAEITVGSMPLMGEEDDLSISGALQERKEDDVASLTLAEQPVDSEVGISDVVIPTALEAEEGGEVRDAFYGCSLDEDVPLGRDFNAFECCQSCVQQLRASRRGHDI